MQHCLLSFCFVFILMHADITKLLIKLFETETCHLQGAAFNLWCVQYTPFK